MFFFRTAAVKEGGWMSDIFQNVTLPGQSDRDTQPSLTLCKFLYVSEKTKQSSLTVFLGSWQCYTFSLGSHVDSKI